MCPNCGAEQNLDITSEKQTEKFQKAERFLKCWLCSNGYELNLMQALKSLLNFHSLMNKSDSEIFFRLYIRDKEDKQ